jgi:ribonuclease Z
MTRWAIVGAVSLIAALAYVQGYSDGDHGKPFSFIASALAAQKPKTTPTGTLHDPNVYFPGTEALAPDEMRLISCGTGMPTARESQAASCG